LGLVVFPFSWSSNAFSILRSLDRELSCLSCCFWFLSNVNLDSELAAIVDWVFTSASSSARSSSRLTRSTFSRWSIR
jgi:hypothetical protein